MGAQDRRRRRAAERRRAAQQRRGVSGMRAAAGGTYGAGRPAGDPGRADDHDVRVRAEQDRVAEHARVVALVRAMVALTDGTRRDDARLATYADMLLARAAPSEPDRVVACVDGLLRRALARAERGGWPRADLEQLLDRTLGAAHRPVLARVLDDRPLRDLASGLGLLALLSRLPLVEAGAVAGAAARGREAVAEHPKLAQVRALLAKAESTDHPEEAELLSAKAQELVARHALAGLLADAPGDATPRPQVRRIWLDAPYVDAKASLVAEVAGANRCRTASATSLGFCIVVGDARDLDAVELLVTSLLVQAAAAMLRPGRSAGAGEGGRTRSFRRAFLLAYAQRVGERLREATQEANRSAGGDALPVLAAHEQRVAAAFEEAVPHTVTRPGPTFSNGEGWVAGRAAADAAQLDPRRLPASEDRG